MKNPVQMVLNKLPKIKMAMSQLTENDVLVGVPKADTERKDSNEPNNATIAYLNDQGSPVHNIPARPFMQPGIIVAKVQIVEQLKRGAQGALHKDDAAIEKGLQRAGMVAQSSIRGVINAGIAPALSKRTIEERLARGRKGNKPLVDTGQLRNSINYIVRKK